ncbi:Uu.00g024360.m01.CDS01 [Anthostomella pinea]|uniref:ubiquitinyl hydrolase 1 n=1 Tax=Anthostomella pinea TaxID=933095 RepID=A0AAI8W0A6_9PEZI|nr:Uu.00g024360.m01.CDS01 [Anthostomella pinea]
MGEGKSSVIVQIVAVHLADGTRLVCVIVAKPQSKQMRHMLVTKLGGLLDRQVHFLPFSRSVIMDHQKLELIRNMLQSCMTNGGVLMIQPEEVLSFKLMGLELVGTNTTGRSDAALGKGMVRLQQYVEDHSRYIIDESDENFSVKFELVYTIGMQKAIDMSPERWIIIQEVLGLINSYASEAMHQHPDGILRAPGRNGQFPLLRFLRVAAADSLLQSVARHIRDKGIHGLALAHQSSQVRQIVFKYITQVGMDEDDVRLGETGRHGFFSDKIRNVLYLLKGLFVGGVLAFAFGQKRWRVNYGIAKRSLPTMLAVPYRAKDSPAPRSEFSHPDIVIVLTCLSHYYGGLSEEALDTAFEQLGRSDQGSMAYGDWVKESPSLEQVYHQLAGVNLKDRAQCVARVYPALRQTKTVVDFYLRTVVFPQEMVEFPKKLSASGWDLARPKRHPITGFSGTCDSKLVLPIEVEHIDLPE